MTGILSNPFFPQKEKKLYRKYAAAKRVAYLNGDVEGISTALRNCTAIIRRNKTRMFPDKTMAETLKEVIPHDKLIDYKQSNFYKDTAGAAIFWGVPKRDMERLLKLYRRDYLIDGLATDEEMLETFKAQGRFIHDALHTNLHYGVSLETLREAVKVWERRGLI